MGANLSRFLADSPLPAADIAFTLAAGRQGFAHRRFVVAHSAAQAASLLATNDAKVAISGKASERKRSLAFMFAGGGAQHPGMGADLYAGEAVYRTAVDECISLLQPRLDWEIKRLLLAPDAERTGLMPEMERPSRSLPCLFITQYAMARLCLAWGLQPTAMIGHSMGEYTAAHLSGVFSLDDVLRLVMLRGQLFEKVAPGGMLSVPLSAEDLTRRLPKELSIAAVNAPELCVASGPVAALEQLESELAAADIEGRRVHIRLAAHSSMLEPILAEFGAFFKGVKLAAPEKPFISNVTGTWITAAEATSPEYWVRHLRNTVRFADGVGTLLEDEGRLMLEVGPGRTLATLAGLHPLRKPEQATVTSMRHPDERDSDVDQALGMLGRLWMHGADVAWREHWKGERRRRVPLPTYPFEHMSYFHQPGKLAAAAPSLVRKADVGSWFSSPAWRRSPLGVRAAATEPVPAGQTLVFCDEGGVGDALARRLAAEGPVVTVVPGAKFGARGATQYAADPTDPDHMLELLVTLGRDGGVPSRIVHAWNLDPAGGALTEQEGRAFYSLLGLLQAIAAEGLEDELQLDVLTAGAQRVGGEEALQPLLALVQGPVRVAGKELPNVRARSIDFAIPAVQGAGRSRVVDQAVRELRARDDARVIAWRGADRYVQDFSSTALSASADSGKWIRDGAVCVITGGQGGLGQLIAAELAGSAKVKLVLMGRRAVQKDDAALQGLVALGAEVMAVQADVSDEAQLSAALDAARVRFGGITHLVHAAGVVEDALIPMKERDSAARVLAPKVRGTLALERMLAKDPLERIVLFSSRGAIAGVAGQVDYTAASAFLDAWAERKSAIDGVDTVSIDWSAWQGVGLAAALAGGGNAKRNGGRKAGHPLLEHAVKESDDEAVYEALLGTESHWLLDGHRIRGGEALIPGTGYLEIARAAGEERAAMGRLEIRDVYFIAPFVVHGDAKREMRVTVEGRAERDVVIEGRSPGALEWEEHARAVVAPLAGEAPARIDPAAIRKRCNGEHLTFTGEEKREHLELGRRWSNIVSLDYGKGEALATLRLPPEFAGETAEFRLHPALLDVATACAQSLIPGFDHKTDFYIPVSYGRVRVWQSLGAECLSHIRLQPRVEEGQDTAVYDVTLLSPSGEVMVDISDFTMMRVKERVTIGRDEAKYRLPAMLRDEIKPAEGVDAFRRIVSSGLSGQVIVSPQDLGAYLASLTAPVEQAAPSVASAPEEPPVEVSQLEAVLAAQEAVHQVVVTAHRERGGNIRITAFVVFELGEQATISELRRYLRGKVPDDVIPQHLIELDQLPLGKDGKVDRAALPDPFAGQDDFVGPRTEMERTIAKIWVELLGVSRVSIYDNFLDVGGHSLLAMRAVSRIAKTTGVRLNPSVMTLHTLEQIAAECAEKAGVAR